MQTIRRSIRSLIIVEYFSIFDSKSELSSIMFHSSAIWEGIYISFVIAQKKFDSLNTKIYNKLKLDCIYYSP